MRGSMRPFNAQDPLAGFGILEEQTRMARRRYIIYCTCVLGLLCLSLWASLEEYLGETRAPANKDLPV